MKPRRPDPLWFLIVNAAYLLAALVGWPYYLFLLTTRKKYRSGMGERWGFVPKFNVGLKPRFWVHCISVGEVEAARTFIPALASAYPQAEIVLSTTTMTGRQRARKRFPDLRVFHFPIDLAPSIRRALKRVKPSAVIQVESEWWPNFFFMAARRNIPVVCVNVRMTERARGYRRIRPIMRAVFNTCRAIGVQADLYRDRLLDLGTDADRIRVTGQMKHDGVTFADSVDGAEDLAREMKIEPGESVLVAGSTGPGEEETLLAAYRQARRLYPRLRLVIVPRRPENFGAAAAAILAAGLGVVRRSRTTEWQGPKRLPPVILGDTMGELMKWYALADIVFIGRTLVPLGGSNPMEPGSLAKPLLWGPHMFNFPVEAPALIRAGAARQTRDAADLADAVADLLTHPERRRQMGEAARQAIRGMQGATARTIDLVREALGI